MDVYLVASEIKVRVLLRGLRILEGLTFILQSEGGGALLCKLYRYVQRQSVWFLSRFGLK